MIRLPVEARQSKGSFGHHSFREGQAVGRLRSSIDFVLESLEGVILIRPEEIGDRDMSVSLHAVAIATSQKEIGPHAFQVRSSMNAAFRLNVLHRRPLFAGSSQYEQYSPSRVIKSFRAPPLAAYLFWFTFMLFGYGTTSDRSHDWLLPIWPATSRS